MVFSKLGNDFTRFSLADMAVKYLMSFKKDFADFYSSQLLL